MKLLITKLPFGLSVYSFSNLDNIRHLFCFDIFTRLQHPLSAVSDNSVWLVEVRSGSGHQSTLNWDSVCGCRIDLWLVARKRMTASPDFGSHHTEALNSTNCGWWISPIKPAAPLGNPKSGLGCVTLAPLSFYFNSRPSILILTVIYSGMNQLSFYLHKRSGYIR